MKQLAFAVLLAIALGLFTYTAQRYIRVMLRGRPDLRPRFDQLPKRLLLVLVYFFGQKKVAEHQIPPARPSTHHLFIFWGFLIVAFNLIVLAMIAYAFFRRIVVKPRLIPMNLDAGLILGGIATLMISYFTSESMRAVAAGHTAV